ncbi:MAG: contractile injection system protein, VgrG/Pvc8 family [Acidimicrobiia bacterium]|nr:contractile injection system protein, VgrG/Pvc8 family [Acidimicrobiia bacterium]
MTDTEVHPYASHAPVINIGSQTEGQLGRDLLRLDVREGCLGLRCLVAHFHGVAPDSDGSAEQISYLDGEVLDIGSALEVIIGPPGGERQVFTGTISAIEASFEEGQIPYVSVFAEDALMQLRMRERTATYTDMTDSQMVAEIASDHGLSDAADAEGPTYPLVQQWEESDLSFVRNRALRLNAEVWVDSDDVVHFSDREQRDGAELELVQGNQLIKVQARVDLAHQRAEVEFRGWDDGSVEAIAETAGSDLIEAEVAGGRTGPDVVSDVFGEPGLSRARRDVLSGEAAQAYADAEMRRRARGFVTIDGTTSGTPDLVPGAKLALHRVGRPFDGEGYRVAYAHHSYDLVTGYRTMFRAERASVAE